MSDLAASSPRVCAEVMETDVSRVGRSAAGGAASEVSKHWEGKVGGGDVRVRCPFLSKAAEEHDAGTSRMAAFTQQRSEGFIIV